MKRLRWVLIASLTCLSPACGGGGGGGSQNPVNQAPQATGQSLSTPETVSLGIILSGSDPEGSPLTYAISAPPASGVLTGVPPAVTYTPNPGFKGPDIFKFIVSDGTLYSGPAQITINVTPVNHAPTAPNQSLTTAMNASLNITLSGIDPDGDSLGFTVTTPPVSGVLTGTVPTLTYTPNAGFTGSDNLAFTVTDGSLTSAPATILITVGSANAPPVAGPQTLQGYRDAPLSITLTGTDPDGNPLTFGVNGAPHGVLSGTAPNLTYKPEAGFIGTDAFSFTVNDGLATSAPAIVTILVQALPPGSLVWARTDGGLWSESASRIALLADGSMIIVGTFSGTGTFGRGLPTETTYTSFGFIDIYVARYDRFGNLVWAKRAGSSGSDGPNDVAVLPDGTVFVGGMFTSPVSGCIFGAGEANQTTLFSHGERDLFLARYNPDGTLAWVRGCGGNDADEVAGLSLLPDGSTLVVGQFSTTTIFGAGEPNETTLIATPRPPPFSSQGSDLFLAKYNPDGNLAWARKTGTGAEYEFAHGIRTLPDGSALVAGGFTADATLGAGEAGETTLPFISGSRFLARFNPNGALAWARQFAGVYSFITPGSIAALDDGTAFVTGTFTGTATFGAGEAQQTDLVSAGDLDGFLARFTPTGQLSWVRRAGGVQRDAPTRLAVLPDGTTLLTGSFGYSTTGVISQATFGAGQPNETTLNTTGDADIFLVKYSPDGQLSWARRAGGIHQDTPMGLGLLSDGSAILVGAVVSPAVFGQGEPLESTLTPTGWVSNSSNPDLFIARYR